MNKLIFTAILSGFAGLYAMGQNEIRLMDMDLINPTKLTVAPSKGNQLPTSPPLYKEKRMMT